MRPARGIAILRIGVAQQREVEALAPALASGSVGMAPPNSSIRSHESRPDVGIGIRE